ncbi:MAG TPA: methyltransferase domain-containing protein [Solirubrobacteraceae bacterium]|nr:methyltransferase domain-containing protein [Solirubrobacteraceae bacterium]
MSKAIWHDLECGSYSADLEFWLALAARTGGPVLDVGAGTGRIALELARAGHEVTAIDLDDDLLAALRERAAGLEVTTIVADARAFWLGTTFPLIIVPMQTIQLLGGAEGRAQFLECATFHLESPGALAIAIADDLELFDVSAGTEPGPLPDVVELDGIVYSSRPVAVRADDGGFELERRRETVTAAGELTAEQDLIHLDRLDPDTLEAEGTAAGLRPVSRLEIAPTADYVGSTVVMFRG